MAPQQMTLFDQLVDQIASGQPVAPQGDRFVPIEQGATWGTGMRRPPIRANVQTGQLTLPLPERVIPGEVIQPRNLEAAGINSLPWERTVAGATPAAAPASVARASQAAPTLAGQLSMLDGDRVAMSALPNPPPPNLAANAAASNAATSGASKGLTKYVAKGKIGYGRPGANAVAGALVAAAPDILGFQDDSVAERIRNEAIRGAGGGMGFLGWPGAAVGGVGQGVQQGMFELGRASKDWNPAAKVAKDAWVGTVSTAMPGGPAMFQIPNMVGEVLPEDWGVKSVSEVPGAIAERIPWLGDKLKEFGVIGGGEGDQQQQEAPSQYDVLAQSGFGSDAADVERRQQVFTALQGTGIDQDIAFSVAWGDTPIGQQVTSANNTNSPFGDLQQWSQGIAQDVQPYVDQMRSSAASLGQRMSGNTSLADYAPALVDLTNANAAALQGFATQYPYLMEQQRRGKYYNDIAESLARSQITGSDSGSDNSFLSYLGIDPSTLQQQ